MERYIKKVPDARKFSFEEQIQYLRQSSIGTPQMITVDLSVANNNLEFSTAGNFFYVLQCNDDADTFNVRFNEMREPAIPMLQQRGFKTPFYRFFITNAAQPNAYAVIIYASLSNEFIEILDNRSQTSTSLIGILNQLQGDNAPDNWGRVAIGAAATQIVAANANRKSFFCQHDVTGVGLVYLGFNNTVTNAINVVALAAGDTWAIDDYAGAIWGIRSGAATNLQISEV